ncbi:MAG TPA: sigma-70 family RNA polymerase sigma factor [Thermoanaerobaculia bacterium]|nr:sigma-70 family RNA polymerase sigma factor [Thermoanaerobaculia bacterium]
MDQQTLGATSPGEITRLLAAARQGDGSATHRLVALLYDELRAMARSQLRRRRPGQTIDTTVLVHEAYLRLVVHDGIHWQDRSHFLSVAALAMRHILVDAARRRVAKKRGGEDIRIPFEELRLGPNDEPDAETRAIEVLAVDHALTSLAALNERLSKLVELRFFAGLTEEEAAEVMGTSERTVRRDWRKARAYLFQALGGQAAG